MTHSNIKSPSFSDVCHFSFIPFQYYLMNLLLGLRCEIIHDILSDNYL